MKYIMLDKRYPVTFPDMICHSSIRNTEKRKVTSAGFFYIGPGPENAVSTFGAAGSLDGMKPAVEDAGMLTLYFKGLLEPLSTLQAFQVVHGVRTVDDFGLGRKK
jgi:hypothetical protein